MAASPEKPRHPSRILAYLSIEEGEFGPTLLLSLYLMLGMATVICLKAVSDAVFLSGTSPRLLPYVDLAITAFVGLVVGLYLRLSSRLGLTGAVLLTQAFLTVNLFAFWLMLRAHVAAAPVLIYVWVGVFAVLIPSQVWTLAGLVFNTRQAKRLFSLVGSGGILGAALGGSFAGYIGPALGTENVLLATIGFVLASSAIVWRLSGLARPASPSSSSSHGRSTIIESMRLVGGERYLLLIALTIFLSTIPGTLIKYQFKALSSAVLAPDRDALTSFYGYFYGYIAVFSFLFHTLLTGRILRALGLGWCLFLLPIALLTGSAGLLISTTFTVAILARGADQGFRHSIDRASLELLYIPIPANIRNKVKSFIDIFVTRSADAVANIALVLLVDLGRTDARHISWVSLALIVPWLYLVWQLKGEYVKTLRSTIERKDVQADELLRSLAESEPPAEIELTLQRSDPHSLETAIDWMQYGGGNAARTQLASLLTHNSSTIRRKAMAVVANHHIDRCEREVMSFLVMEPDIEARWQALGYLEERNGQAGAGVLQGLLESDDRELAATSAAHLLRRGAPDHAKAAAVFSSYIESAVDAQPASRVVAARLIGLAPPENQPPGYLSRFLRDPDPDVVRAALGSAASLQPSEEVPFLIEKLDDRGVRREARDALVAFGEPVVPQLEGMLKNGFQEHGSSREIFRILGAIGGQQSADLLVGHLQRADRVLVYDILRSLYRIRRRQPSTRFDRPVVNNLLTAQLKDLYQEAYFLAGVSNGTSGDGVVFLRRALKERLERRLDEVFHLLALVYPHREILDARHWILSGRPDLRSNALEFLDTRVNNPVRQMLLPALEDRGGKRMLDAGAELFGLAEISYPSVLLRLLEWPDAWLQTCASYVVGEAKLAALSPQLQTLTRAADPMLSETAARAAIRLIDRRGTDPSMN